MIPLATVSGIATTNAGMIDWFARNVPVDVITTKSIQEEPNAGNREPVITEPEPGSFGNAVGLRNPGLAATLAELEALAPHRASWPPGVRLNISIAATDPRGFARLAGKLAPYADMIELNLSCPHAHGGYGADIGRDPDLTRECTAAAVAEAHVDDRNVPVYAKLTPNTDRIGGIARAALEGGATGIVAINTVGPEQYRDPSSGEAILTNPAPKWAIERGEEEMYRGRGGRSGRWIGDRALECIREIRAAVGEEIPIIGMGGIERPRDAIAMRAAGADIVGIGSALSLVEQWEWPALFRSIRDADEVAAGGEDGAAAVRYRESAGMRHRPLRVRERRELGGGFFELELAEALPFSAGQTVFLWVPGVGEKPFSPALADPATFLIRRRGPVTGALGGLAPGEAVYIRGPYGRRIDEAGLIPRAGGRAVILAAGTGLALAPTLIDEFGGAGYETEVWFGVRSAEVATPLERAIAGRGTAIRRIEDNGEEARVLRVFAEENRPAPALVAAIGPEPFMARAAELCRSIGVPADRVLLSLERTMLCGVGLCGACEYGGALTCRHGTFVRSGEGL